MVFQALDYLVRFTRITALSKLLLSFLIFMLLAVQTAHAGPSCKLVHNKKSKIQYPLEKLAALKKSNFPDVKKLEALGFKFDGEKPNQFSVYDRSGRAILSGSFIKVSARHLYHWNDAESTQIWAERGGIEKWEMQETLKEPAQNSGRGFYVSTDKSDSNYYGGSVVIFRPQHELVILAPDYYNNYLSGDTVRSYSTKQMTSLAEAGIDGIRSGINSNWYNIIKHEPLIRATHHEKDYILNDGIY